MNKLNRKGLRALLSPFFLSLLMGVTYSIVSGRYFQISLWVYVMIYSFVGVMSSIVLASKNPSRLNQRGEARGEKWGILSYRMYLISFFVLMPLLAAYDTRAHELLSMDSYLIGLIIYFISLPFSLIPFFKNPYFQSFAYRVDNKKIVDTGLHRLIRHPAYTGMLLSTLAQPLLLRSRFSAVLSFILVVLIFVRTYKEDKFLENNLKGYQAYTEKTKDMLIPYIW